MSEETSTPSYYAIIPAKVRYDPELRPNAKLLYAEITALANAEGYCWMQNEGFGKLFGLATKSVSSLISQLSDKGYIKVEVIRDPETKVVIQRRIWVDTPPHRKKEDTPSPQKNGDPLPAKEDTPPPQKAAENNTSKVFNNPPISPKGGRRPDGLCHEVKDLLNSYVGHDLELADELGLLMDVRIAKRAVNSPRAIKGLLGELDKLSGGNRETKLLLLKQASLNSWKSVFPLKGGFLPSQQDEGERHVI